MHLLFGRRLPEQHRDPVDWLQAAVLRATMAGTDADAGAAEVVVVDAVGCGEQLVAKLTGGGLRWQVRTKSARGTREERTAEVSAGAS